jgi:hypothetical protein
VIERHTVDEPLGALVRLISADGAAPGFVVERRDLVMLLGASRD